MVAVGVCGGVSIILFLFWLSEEELSFFSSSSEAIRTFGIYDTLSSGSKILSQ